jgi:hypothetical protein
VLHTFTGPSLTACLLLVGVLQTLAAVHLSGMPEGLKAMWQELSEQLGTAATQNCCICKMLVDMDSSRHTYHKSAESAL